MDKTLTIRKIAAWLLFPLTMWYPIGMALRNQLFDLGLKRERTHGVTTIGVGNLSTGGTGKTPHVEYLLGLLKDEYPVAMLSRGYRRKTKGFVEADGDTSVYDIGDEPFQMARKFSDVRVAVCEKRNAGVERLMESENPPQVVVLDDVFQHRHIKPTVNILLTEFRKPYFKDCTLPFGNLREPRRGCRRADIVIVTKVPPQTNFIEIRDFVDAVKVRNYQKLFFSSFEYGAPVALNPRDSVLDVSEVADTLLFTGIANPQPLLERLSEHSNAKLLQFPDHHDFSDGDVNLIEKEFGNIKSESKAIFTTEKDAVRLLGNPLYEKISHLPIFYLPVTVKLFSPDHYDFDELIRRCVDENIKYLGNRHGKSRKN